MRHTTEKQVADTILQQPKRMKIGARYYTVSAPTTAHLIMASAAISELPYIDIDNQQNVLEYVLKEAQHCTAIGKVLATMLVSARGSMGRGLLHRVWEWRVARLSRRLMERSSNDDMIKAAYELLSRQQVQSFFALIAFLGGVNMTKPTKATASGQ
ncbi:MAG: hypothetical protein IJV22_06135 [Bacteroidales bacterium]|nr:hypothetical protein [Bacteroidales bacterium]